jgi:hypothetical protein
VDQREDQQREAGEIKMWVEVAVEAAEQLYKGSGRGAEKKAMLSTF